MAQKIMEYWASLQHSDIPNYMVVLLGVGIVFFGLICIVFLIKIVGLFFKKANNTVESVAPIVTQTINEPIANRQEIIAAVSAVIAEELGTDISAIRIHSFKKI